MKKTLRRKTIRHAKSKERRRLRRIRILRQRRSGASIEPTPFGEQRIHAPAYFALEPDGHHDEVADFLGRLRELFLNGKEIICIDFRNTKRMVAGGTLLFYSELQRLREMFPFVGLRCRPSRDKTVNEVLQHLGIFTALGYRSDVVPERSDVISWRSASSEEIDGKKVGSLLLKYESLSGPIAGNLFRGTGEAMFNVRHAYVAERRDGLPDSGQKKWWMFCRESEEHVVAAVCDLGIGIPRSLPIKYPSEIISKIVSKFPGVNKHSDAKMIHAAMQIRRSSTNLEGRGKGLSDFLKIIDAVPDAKLFIFSNKGLVKYSSGTYKRVTYKRSIKGTVVVWVIPLQNNGE